jgi:hypothetical protein
MSIRDKELVAGWLFLEHESPERVILRTGEIDYLHEVSERAPEVFQNLRD